jgi:outer membrane receptor protein involved in Fe transport
MAANAKITASSVFNLSRGPALKAAAGVLAALVVAQGAWAADAASGPQTSLTEVVVTAQKREQNLQDVPIAVMALSGQELKDAGVTDIKNMQILTPGLTVTSTTSEASTTARIRGIGTVGDNVGLESSVGVVIDGVYRPRNGVGFGDLGDVDRIEVLEGPQGELFGKNNDAGVINVITRRPSRTFSVEGEISGGNFSDREIRGSVTGPVGDMSAFLLYAGYQKRDGFLDVANGPGPNTDDRANDRNFWTVRGQYLMTPSKDVSLLIIGDFTRRIEVCCQATPSTSGPFAGIINAMATIPPLGGTETPAQAFPVTNPMPFSGQSWANWPIGQDIWDRGFSAQLDWDFGGAKLTSITAWRDNTVYAGNDVDYTEVALIQNPSNIDNMTDFKQISEELRLAGKSDKLTWLFGAWFDKEILTTNSTILADNAFDLYLGGVSSAAAGVNPPNFLLVPELTGNAPGGTFLPGISGQSDKYYQTNKSYAFFTDETYNFTDQFALTAGIRWTHDFKQVTANYLDPDGGSACGQLLAPVGAPGTPFVPQLLLGYGCSTPFNPFFNGITHDQSLSESNVNGTVKLSYRFTPDMMGYVSWANGTKAGGFNLARVTNPEAANPLAPVLDTEFPRETVESYELGFKSEWANHTLRVNAAAFDQRYNNFQLNTFTGIVFVVSSIEKVESKGAELSFDWLTPLSGLSFSGGVVYADTEIKEFGDSAPLFSPARENNRLSFAPLWSGVISAAYQVPLGSSLRLRVSADEKYNSSYNTGSDLDPAKIQAAYGILNARIGIGAPDGKWTFEVWGANLANKGYYQVAFDAPYQGIGQPGLNQIDSFVADQRTYGATIRVRF